MLERFQRRIREKAEDAHVPPVLIVALGDSVTQGCTVAGKLEPDAVYHHRLKQLLEKQNPKGTFSVINAGVGGDNAPGGVGRLDRDVVRHAPDLLLVAFGLNDAHGKRDGMYRFRTALELIVLRAREYSEADVVLLTPSFMNMRDNDLVAGEHRELGYVEMLMQVQNDGWLAEYSEAIRDIGRRHNVPVADVYAAWERLEQSGIDTTALLANGLNHPSAAAHRIPAELVMQVIELSYQPHFEQLHWHEW